MILNGRQLYDARPLSPMSGMKLREHGVSYGLAEAWFMLTVPHLNYEPEPEEPGLRRIKTALAELKEETHE